MATLLLLLYLSWSLKICHACDGVVASTGICYLFVAANNQTYEQGKDFCHGHGMILASMDTERYFNGFREMMNLCELRPTFLLDVCIANTSLQITQIEYLYPCWQFIHAGSDLTEILQSVIVANSCGTIGCILIWLIA